MAKIVNIIKQGEHLIAQAFIGPKRDRQQEEDNDASSDFKRAKDDYESDSEKEDYDEKYQDSYDSDEAESAKQYRKTHPPPKSITKYARENLKNTVSAVKTRSEIVWKYPGTDKILRLSANVSRDQERITYEDNSGTLVFSIFLDEDEKIIKLHKFYYEEKDAKELRKNFQPFITMHFLCHFADYDGRKILLTDANEKYSKKFDKYMEKSYYWQFGFGPDNDRREGDMIRMPCSRENIEFLKQNCGPEKTFDECRHSIREKNRLELYRTSCYLNTKDVVTSIRNENAVPFPSEQYS